MPAWAQALRRAWRRLILALDATLIGEAHRLPLWTPVLLALGSAAYFSLRSEPNGLWAVVLPLGPALGLVWLTGRHRGAAPGEHPGRHTARCALVALALVGVGFAAAQWRTQSLKAPTVTEALGRVPLEALVLSRERTDTGEKFIVRPLKIGSERELKNLPRRLDLRVRWSGNYQKRASRPPVRPGDAIFLFASVYPAPQATEPGGFDYRRWVYFKGIQGMAWSTMSPRLIDRPPDLERPIGTLIERVRERIVERIDRHLVGAEASLAAALIVGKRDGITEELEEALRDAGLAHILAISGLHMGLFGGLVFAGLRVLGALVPTRLSDRSIKHAAAIGGLIGAFGYLVLSGAAVSTQRAFITLALMFIAILIDRRAISLRLVATAATLILLFRPESVFDAGFQLSFAAVTVLVASIEWYRRAAPGPDETTLRRPLAGRALGGVASRVGKFWLAIGTTTLLAGLATGPIAAFHFNQIANYGLLGNLLAMPLVTVLIMPAAVATFVAMPFGFEAVPLAIMGEGLSALVGIARWVSGLAGATTAIGALPTVFILSLIGGALWLIIWQQRWRYAGAVAMVASVFFIGLGERPDILIDDRGRALAVKTVTGERAVFKQGRSTYALDQWLRRDGLGEEASDGAPAIACEREACKVELAGSDTYLLVVKHRRAVLDECDGAAIVLSRHPLPCGCRRSIEAKGGLVIDPPALSAQGAHALWLGDEGIRVRTVRGESGLRPWTQAGEPMGHSATGAPQASGDGGRGADYCAPHLAQ
ncbi:MAG: ComEC/Rec2 family competence protein [Pseudomonadota bacterium]